MINEPFADASKCARLGWMVRFVEHVVGGVQCGIQTLEESRSSDRCVSSTGIVFHAYLRAEHPSGPLVPSPVRYGIFEYHPFEQKDNEPDDHSSRQQNEHADESVDGQHSVLESEGTTFVSFSSSPFFFVPRSSV
jgi:hypothetical protein